MSGKGLNSPFVRRIITVVLFSGIAVALMAMYYLIYLPQQQNQFNQRTFRVLKEISNNFSHRVENYGVAYSSAFISKLFPDSSLKVQRLKTLSNASLNTAFKNSFTGDVSRLNAFKISQRVQDDSIIYTIKNGRDTIEASRKFSDLLNPLIAIHSSTFESVLFIKRKTDTVLKPDKGVKIFDTILYKSGAANVVNIDTDSLLGRNFVSSAIVDIKIEGSDYKMFIVPFKVKSIASNTFLLAGLISRESYQQQSKAIPVNFLFTVGFFLILMLLALPFIKIFVLSIQENIVIADVRLIIAVIFIIPFVITTFVSAIWLYKYPEGFSGEVLSHLQDNVRSNFYKEIEQGIGQAKTYDALIENITADSGFVDSCRKAALEKNPGAEPVNVKDLLFYPALYKNIENVHWMNAAGDDIAAWNFIRQPAGYFALKDRQYFRDIIYKRGYVLPGSKDTFSILPTLSRLTGEFTINLALSSHMQLSPVKKAAVVAISTKMSSVYNTVVPHGFAYCIIDEKGDILAHSDTARNLQENLFEETADNQALYSAVSHKDSTTINDISLYERPVKMMVKPLAGLPYYLVTYYDKRGEYLFITHILGFVILCESIILLFVSLFSYCLMMSNKKLYKLFFIPHVLYWLRPSQHKKEYYVKNSIQLLITVAVVFLFAFFLSRRFYYLYMLNTALLLPLFAVTGYYIIKRAKNFRDANPLLRRITTLITPNLYFNKFLHYVRNILGLYLFSVLIFAILQNVFLYDKECDDNRQVLICIWVLIVIIPLLSCAIALSNYRVIRICCRNILKRLQLFTISKNTKKATPNNYLSHFIVSLLLSVAVVSVIPAITFTGYALHEERKLHFQSFQLDLAKKIQQRRVDINNKLWQTKVLQFPQAGKIFIDSLKFKKDKGLYLFSNLLQTENMYKASPGYNSCSPFYKLITQFLFLPPDHDEFYDNPSHTQFYSWQEDFDKQKADSLTLIYKNLVDYRNPTSIVLQSEIPHFYVFKDITKNPSGYLLILAILVFILLFYKMIYSIAKRIFLVGFFDDSWLNKEKEHDDSKWLKQKYFYTKIEDLVKKVIPEATPTTFFALREKEKALIEEDKNGGEDILKVHLALIPIYEKIWTECSEVEKYTLYDFALDGFTNYKKTTVLYKLIDKGLLIKEDDNFTLFTKSFRNFLITKESSDEIKKLSREGQGSWSIMRSVFYIILLAVAVFIFISQEEASKRLITIVSSLAALLPVILKLFDKGTFTSSSNKQGT